MPKTVGKRKHGPFKHWEKLSVAGGQRLCVRGGWRAENADAGEASLLHTLSHLSF